MDALGAAAGKWLLLVIIVAQLFVKATLRAALNDAIGQQIITFNPAAHVEIDPVRKPKALVWTDERVAKWEQTGEKPPP